MVIGESFNFSMQSESSLHVSPGLLNEECFLLQKVNAMVIKTASSSTHFSHVFRHAVQTLSISQYGVKYRQLGLLSSQLEPLIPFVNLARFRNFSTPLGTGVEKFLNLAKLAKGISGSSCEDSKPSCRYLTPYCDIDRVWTACRKTCEKCVDEEAVFMTMAFTFCSKKHSSFNNPGLTWSELSDCIEKLNDYPITMSKEKFDGYDTNNDGILYWKEYPYRVSQRYNYGDGPGPDPIDKELISMSLAFTICNGTNLNSTDGLTWRKLSDCIEIESKSFEKYNLPIPTITKEGFDCYDTNNDEILTWKEYQEGRNDIEGKIEAAFSGCNTDGRDGLTWMEANHCIENYEGKMLGLHIPTLTKEEFDNVANDGILTWDVYRA